MKPPGLKLAAPIDPDALDTALAEVQERIGSGSVLSHAVRDVCGFLQESANEDILSNLRLHEDPVAARVGEMFMRGIAHGIEIACSHITESDQIRTVRDWLKDSAKEKDA